MSGTYFLIKYEGECSDPKVGKLLPAYFVNELEQENRERFERHLRECETCVIDLSNFRNFFSVLRRKLEKQAGE